VLAACVRNVFSAAGRLCFLDKLDPHQAARLAKKISCHGRIFDDMCLKNNGMDNFLFVSIATIVGSDILHMVKDKSI